MQTSATDLRAQEDGTRVATRVGVGVGWIGLRVCPLSLSLSVVVFG